MIESLVWTPPATAGQPAPERGTTCSGNLPPFIHVLWYSPITVYAPVLSLYTSAQVLSHYKHAHARTISLPFL